MEEIIEEFRQIFDNSDIVKKWKEKGYDHIGTMFFGEEYDISFPMDGGVVIKKIAYLRDIKLDLEMLELIYNTKKYITELYSKLSKGWLYSV